MHNPYTCRLLIRIDKLLYQLRGLRPRWNRSTGKLIVGNGSARTHFPSQWFVLAANVQNQWPITRHILSV